MVSSSGSKSERRRMSAATTGGVQAPPPPQFGEWFWRFLAMVLLFVGGWVTWIAIQINPPDVFLPAAYEAAAQGRASRNASGAVKGVIAPAPGALAIDPAQASQMPAADRAPANVPAVTAPVVTAPPPPPEPPVNLEKLRLAESIETPIHERPKRSARMQ